MFRWSDGPEDTWEDFPDTNENTHRAHRVDNIANSPEFNHQTLPQASLGFRAKQIVPRILQSAAGSFRPPSGPVPSLRATCLALLGRHADAVAQLGPQNLAALPPDVKACMLCVARRRGALTNRVLGALVDEGCLLLDMAGAARLSERAVRQALLRAPCLRALDLSGLSCLTPATLRGLPAACPALEVLAVGGSRVLGEAMLEVLPEILPHVRVQEQPAEGAADDWEAVAEQGPAALAAAGEERGLRRLALLVWPAAPALVRHIVQTRSPRVELLEELPAVTSQPQEAQQQQRRLWGLSGPGVRPSGAGDSWRSHGREEAGEAGHGAGAAAASAAGVGRDQGGRGGAGAGGRGGITVIRAASTSGGGAGQGSSGGSKYAAPHLRQRQAQQAQPPRQQQRLVASEPSEGPPPPAAPPVPAAPLAPPQQPAAPAGAALPHRQPLQGHAAHGARAPRQLDDALAALVADSAWAGLGGERGGDRAAAAEEMHIAERFRLAYVEQDARLRAKAVRDAALEQRRQVRGSGAARELARWLDEE